MHEIGREQKNLPQNNRTLAYAASLKGGILLTPSSLPATIKITTTAEPDPYATERLAAATLDFYHRFMQRPDAKELLERKKAELRARGVRLN